MQVGSRTPLGQDLGDLLLKFSPVSLAPGRTFQGRDRLTQRTSQLHQYLMCCRLHTYNNGELGLFSALQFPECCLQFSGPPLVLLLPFIKERESFSVQPFGLKRMCTRPVYMVTTIVDPPRQHLPKFSLDLPGSTDGCLLTNHSWC